MLARNIGQDVIIRVPGNEPIIVRLVEVCHPGKVRLGIIAAKEIEVHRLEIDEAIHGPLK